MDRRHLYIVKENWLPTHGERLAADWVKENAKTFNGLDPIRYILGQVVHRVTQDDLNILTAPLGIISGNFPEDVRKQILHDGRLKMLDRLEWEASEQIPQDIKTRLLTVRNFVAAQPWVDEASVLSAYMGWIVAKEYVKRESEINPNIAAALRHHFEFNHRVATLSGFGIKAHI